jgi:predicted DNA-binding transcriptional regulator AlpA
MDAISPVAEMERLLDREETARMIGCKPNTLRSMWGRGEFIAPFYLGRLPRWRLKDIVAWIDEQAAKRDG